MFLHKSVGKNVQNIQFVQKFICFGVNSLPIYDNTEKTYVCLINMYCTLGCINFNFFGNIKNPQLAYASLESLKDPKIFFFFFDPKTKFSLPSEVWYFWKIPQNLLVIFSSFLFLRKGQERTENTKKN